jgi:hypothetical protein
VSVLGVPQNKYIYSWNLKMYTNYLQKLGKD